MTIFSFIRYETEDSIPNHTHRLPFVGPTRHGIGRRLAQLSQRRHLRPGRPPRRQPVYPYRRQPLCHRYDTHRIHQPLPSLSAQWQHYLEDSSSTRPSASCPALQRWPHRHHRCRWQHHFHYGSADQEPDCQQATPRRDFQWRRDDCRCRIRLLSRQPVILQHRRFLHHALKLQHRLLLEGCLVSFGTRSRPAALSCCEQCQAGVQLDHLAIRHHPCGPDLLHARQYRALLGDCQRQERQRARCRRKDGAPFSTWMLPVAHPGRSLHLHARKWIYDGRPVDLRHQRLPRRLPPAQHQHLCALRRHLLHFGRFHWTFLLQTHILQPMGTFRL